MDALRRLSPNVPAVACFDTAFHASLEPAASSYALPAAWVENWHLRRYGFHGLSCEWSAGRAAALLDRPASSVRLVICHLGGGASVTATVGGRSVDTTMGFTPTEGLVMATRSGDVDPGAIAWLVAHGVASQELADGLERRSGLLALSGGVTGDMRALLENRARGYPASILAVDVYVHRLRAKIAAMTAATDGTDALVFTAGVGENAGEIRAEACEHLGVVRHLDRRRREPGGRCRRRGHQSGRCEGKNAGHTRAGGACRRERLPCSTGLIEVKPLPVQSSPARWRPRWLLGGIGPHLRPAVPSDFARRFLPCRAGDCISIFSGRCIRCWLSSQGLRALRPDSDTLGSCSNASPTGHVPFWSSHKKKPVRSTTASSGPSTFSSGSSAKAMASAPRRCSRWGSHSRRYARESKRRSVWPAAHRVDLRRSRLGPRRFSSSLFEKHCR